MSSLVAAAILAGCTIVNVDGPAKVSQLHLGVLQITPANDGDVIAYDLAGIGIVPGMNGVTLGYREEAVVAARDAESCTIILLKPDKENIEELIRRLEELSMEEHSDVCHGGG